MRKILLRGSLVVLSVVLIFALVYAAAWVAIGPSGLTPAKIGKGRTPLIITDTNEVTYKYGSEWVNPMINFAFSVCADSATGANFTGTLYELFVERHSEVIRAAEWGVRSCESVSKVVYAVQLDGTLWKNDTALNDGSWYDWTQVSGISGFLQIAADPSGRLWAASATRLYKQNAGTDTFTDVGEIATAASPADPIKIAFKGSDVYVHRTGGTVRKYSGSGTSYAMSQLPITGVLDIAADPVKLYIVQPSGIFGSPDGSNYSPIEVLPYDEVAIEILGGTLRCGTSSGGLYDQNLLPAAPTATATIASGNVNLSWTSVSGASYYVVGYCSDFSSCTRVNVGSATSWSRSATGIRLVYVVAVDATGYESMIGYKPVCNSDTVAPAPIYDLACEANANSIWCTGTVPSDNILLARIEAAYRLVSAGPPSVINWAGSSKVLIVPPGASGSMFTVEITGLPPGTSYYVAARGVDTCNRMSSLVNTVPIATSSASQQRPVTLAWDPSPSAVAGYRIRYANRDLYPSGYNLAYDAKTAMTATLQLGTGTWEFVATAYDASGNESAPSNAVQWINQ